MRADDYPWAPTPEEWRQVIDEDLDNFGSPEWLDDYLEGFSPSIADDEEMKLWWRKWVLSSSSPGALQALRRMNSSIDVRHVLSSISAPTLVLHPVDDEVMALGGGEYIASHVPGAELIRAPRGRARLVGSCGGDRRAFRAFPPRGVGSRRAERRGGRSRARRP